MFNGNATLVVSYPKPKEMMAEIRLLRAVRNFEVNCADWRDDYERNLVSCGKNSSIVGDDLRPVSKLVSCQEFATDIGLSPAALALEQHHRRNDRSCS